MYALVAIFKSEECLHYRYNNVGLMQHYEAAAHGSQGKRSRWREAKSKEYVNNNNNK